MKSKGIDLESQPRIYLFNDGAKDTYYRPDFYCPETDTYYEVIRTKQAYHLHKKQLQLMLINRYKIEVVNPDGSSYKPFQSMVTRMELLYPR